MIFFLILAIIICITINLEQKQIFVYKKSGNKSYSLV